MKTTIRRPLFCSWGLLGCLFVSVQGATIHVSPDSPSLQDAIYASQSGDVIEVAPGDYVLDESLRFHGKAVTLRSLAGPEETTVRRRAPSSEGSVVVFQDGESRDAIFEGFTLTGGTGTDLGTVFGGGILCLNGSGPTLSNLRIVENRATYGGALCCRDSSPLVIDCLLARNAVSCGGGAYLEGSFPHFVRCVIRDNQGNYASSGVHSKSGSAPLFDACTILGNTTYYGGAVDSYQSSPTLVNCVLAGNVAAAGGAAYVANESSLTLLSCTVVSNSSETGPALANANGVVEAQNCIFLRSSVSEDESTNLYSCLLARDPLFRDPGSYDSQRVQTVSIHGVLEELPDFIVREPDFRLTAGSPALDAGGTSGGLPVDLAGVSRPQGGGYDLGAYEYEAAALPHFRRGDCNDDGAVDLSDAVCVLDDLFLGGSSPNCAAAANANGDAAMDLSDAVYLLGYLFLGGPSPPAPFPECGPNPEGESLDCVETARACGS